MCTGNCSLCIAVTLYPLVFVSVLCNILLFFPGWSTESIRNGTITEEVKCMGGGIGGGLMVLTAALFIQKTGEQGSCGNRCGLSMVVVASWFGAFESLFRYCKKLHYLFILHIFISQIEISENINVFSLDRREECTNLENMAEFNVTLFSILLVTSILQFFLCGAQMINGLLGCLCGTSPL
uniref:Si:ch211-137i24.10 n=1 Tax=Astyanax mexicanus TaxID=7994 RepID=A0A3B1JAS8_ASTMX